MTIETLPMVRVGRPVGCATYRFDGDWDPLDRGVVEAALRQCIPAWVDNPVYNTWLLMCLSGRFVARRELWNMQSLYARDAGELARHLLDHYNKGRPKPEECPCCRRPLTVNGDGCCACCSRIIIRQAA